MMDDTRMYVQSTLLEIEQRARAARLRMDESQEEEYPDPNLTKGELTSRVITVIGQLAQLPSSIISCKSVRDIQNYPDDSNPIICAAGKTTFLLKIEYDGGEWKRRFGKDSDAPK